jgi:Mrp family chromosome partitioning ATPase
MTKIYEALKLTEGKSQTKPKRSDTIVTLYSRPPQEPTVAVEMQKRMAALYWNICTVLPENENRIIHFIDASKSSDGFIVVRQFVKTLTSAFAKSVLLLDATFKSEHLRYFNLHQDKGWENILRGRESITALAQPIPNTNLSVASFTVNAKPITSIIDIQQLRIYLKQLQQHFDLIVIDTSSPELSFDGIALSSMTQGTVMIVESEKTRWQVAENIKSHIEKSGGKVIGIFVNKRKHYIPQFIYKFL